MITVALLEALVVNHTRKRPPRRHVLAWWRWRAELIRLEDALAEMRLVQALQAAHG